MSTTGDTGNLLDGGSNGGMFDLADIFDATEQHNQQRQQDTDRTNGAATQATQSGNGADEANKILARQLAEREAEIARVLEDNKRLQQQSSNRQNYTNVDGGATNQQGGLVQPTVQTDQWGRIKEEYNQRSLTDPVGVVMELLKANNENLTQIIDQRLGTVAGSTVNLEVQNFRSYISQNDPDWKIAQQKFDLFASSPDTQKALAAMAPGTRQQALQMMYDAVANQSRREMMASKASAQPERREVPLYGEGGDYAQTGGAPSIASNSTFNGKPLNETQRGIMESLTPEFIKAYPQRVKAMLLDAVSEG